MHILYKLKTQKSVLFNFYLNVYTYNFIILKDSNRDSNFYFDKYYLYIH